MSADIKLNKAQFSKIIQSGGFPDKTLGNMMGNLGKKSLMDVAISLAKDAFSKLANKARSGKNVDHHGWTKEKVLDFECPKTAQMALKFLVFYPGYFKIYLGFLFSVKTIFANLFLFASIFSGSVQNEAILTLYQFLYKYHFQEVVIRFHLLVEI